MGAVGVVTEIALVLLLTKASLFVCKQSSIVHWLHAQAIGCNVLAAHQVHIRLLLLPSNMSNGDL